MGGACVGLLLLFVLFPWLWTLLFRTRKPQKSRTATWHIIERRRR